MHTGPEGPGMVDKPYGVMERRAVIIMKKFTFEDYREALEDAGPKLKVNILERAEQDKNIEFLDFVRLCKLAYPEPA